MKLEDNIYANFFVNIMGNSELPFPADQISFSIQDSIHRIFPRLSVSLKDQTGYFQEYLLTNPGNIVDLEFGTLDDPLNFVRSKFIIDTDQLSALGINPAIFTGMLDIEFFHEWYNYQKEETGYFDGTISSIVSKLILEYPFLEKEIESTNNSTTWYMGGKTRSSVIRDVFCKRAYSSSSDKTPFFAFINANNKFHFQSYRSLLGNTQSADFDYLFDRTSSFTNSFKYSIIDIKRWSSSLTQSKQYQHRNFHTIENDGTVETEELLTDTFLKKPLKDTYNISNSKEKVVQSDTCYFGQENIDNRKGIKNSLMKSELFRNQFMILVPFNPKATAGKTVFLKLSLPNTENDSFSQRFTGKYLIESSSHIWDGPSKNAMSKLIVSRKYIQVPESYPLKGSM